MMFFLLALTSALMTAVLAGAGYVAGARRSSETREALLLICAEQRRRITDLERRAAAATIREDIDLQGLLCVMRERDRESRILGDTVRTLIGPLVERERLSHELSHLPRTTGATGALAELVNAIADKGGFSAVLLSDDVGLPLATSHSARDVDLLIGVSTLLLTLGDRIAMSGAAPPNSVVLRDGDGQSVVHRIFTVDGARYLLTAVARGTSLAPDSLDPALGAVEATLSREAGL